MEKGKEEDRLRIRQCNRPGLDSSFAPLASVQRYDPLEGFLGELARMPSLQTSSWG